MAPSNYTRAAVILIGLPHDLRAFFIILYRDLVDYSAGNVRRLAQPGGHLLRSLPDRIQNLRPIQELRAYNEPKFIILQHILSALPVLNYQQLSFPLSA